MRALRNLRVLVAVLVLLVVIGTAGFHFIEGWSWFDGFYMVITTFTTIGYTEVHSLSQAGRVFNVFLILMGVGNVFLIIGALTQSVLEVEFNQFFGRRKMEREISRLTGHYIICGAGRVGRSVARELARKPAPFVVVESDPDKAAKYNEEGWPIIIGDATKEQILKQARIEHAAGLVAASTTDAINTYIVLTARGLNPKLKIIARASEDDAEKHLKTAGADSVISPYIFAGYRIAHSFLRPNVLDFIEIAMLQNTELGLEIEEISVGEVSRFAGKTVRDSHIRQELDVIVLAIKRPGQQMLFNPKSDDMIKPGDQIVVMGQPERLRKLEEMARL
jgi:voltage-gated potassium channel